MMWSDIAPKDAVDLDLRDRPDLRPPLNENGEPCRWPWDPQQLTGAPIGQYRCQYCGAMCMAGVQHPDYRDEYAQGCLEARYGLFTDDEIAALRSAWRARSEWGHPAWPGITVILTGQPRSQYTVIAAVLRACAVAGQEFACPGFIAGVTKVTDLDHVVHAAMDQVTVW